MEFSEYVAARRTQLVRSAVLLGCPTSDAEDLVQSTLTKAFRSWSRVSRASQPDAYVYRILTNTLRDNRSRRWTDEVPTEVLPTTAADDADVTTGLAVRRALAAMSREHREVLVLRFYADLSEADTAAALGIPAGTAKSRTARALAALATDDDIRSTRC
jgi:RNA polymerase sigma-70 factor (sigma-E family)